MKKSITQKTLVILDAHAIIHRAYHALPSFTTSDGVPTGALYGLTSMLLRIIDELKPDAIVAAYDLPKPTFRHHAYDAYKQGRAKTDDALVAQLESSRNLFRAFNIECLDSEGFEADDIIGTITEQYRTDPAVKIIIASGDMDTLQLVEDKKVLVYTLKKGVNDTILYDEEAVVARYGFTPEQLVDYKGLRGDPSDNIVGVPGIGEKTATAIIQTFGSVEALYDALVKDESSGKRAGLSDRITKLLIEHKDDALFSKTLATIRRDAPVSYTIPDGSYRDTVSEKEVTEFIAAHEFRSLLPRVRALFAFVSQKTEEPVDEMLLQKASIAQWVLFSEQATPTLEMIFNRTKKETLPEAYEVLCTQLKTQGLWDVFSKLEEPLIPIIETMQKHGIAIDVPYFESLKIKLRKELDTIEATVAQMVGVTINLNSPKQLSGLLFETLGLKPKGKQKASGAYTTNAEALESLADAHPVIPHILRYRELQKLLTTYVESLIEHAQDGRVHAQFSQHGSATGRFSSANPNLQNIPIRSDAGKEIRRGFVAAPGHVFIGSDYSQIELRMLAILSKDEALRDAFVRGDDIHQSVAATMFKVAPDAVTSDMRRSAKVINFGIIYGMGVSALQKNLNTDRKTAQTFYDEYFRAFPTIGAYLEKTKVDAKTKGYTETLFGRRRYFPSINTGAPFMRAFAERMASNAPIQGSAADVIKIAIALVDEDLRKVGLIDDVHLVLQVHDELIYEVKESAKERAEIVIKSAMEEVLTRSPIVVDAVGVPLRVSIGIGKRLDELK